MNQILPPFNVSYNSIHTVGQSGKYLRLLQHIVVLAVISYPNCNLPSSFNFLATATEWGTQKLARAICCCSNCLAASLPAATSGCGHSNVKVRWRRDGDSGGGGDDGGGVAVVASVVGK